MSRKAQPVFSWDSPQIVPTDHDVLSGRGVNIAQHPGNERFRALVNSRYDSNYCSQYSTPEKRAVATEIITHIKSLDPPGRFLKRVGRSKNARGLEGPWEELTEQEVIKKTCQALRDCNRQDRSGYAASVAVPDDVRMTQEKRATIGLSNKELAERAAAMRDPNTHFQGQPSHNSFVATSQVSHSYQGFQTSFAEEDNRKRAPASIDTSVTENSLSPCKPESLDWFKKPRLSYADATPISNTPTTAASSGGILQETSFIDSVPSSTASQLHRQDVQDYADEVDSVNIPPSPALGHDHLQSIPNSPSAAFEDPTHHMPPSPGDFLTSSFHDNYLSHPANDDNGKIHAASYFDQLHLTTASLEHNDVNFDNHQTNLLVGEDFPPPSPLHPGHHHIHHHNNNNGEEAASHDHFDDL